MKKGKDGIYNKYIKRMLDFTLALLALIILFPIFLVLSIIGVFAMNGNPFFVQERAGMIDSRTRKEKIFKLIKFRTMSNAKDKNGVLLPDIKRLNKYGRLLRASSLDEIPELINIVAGHMSIVGPRPLPPIYLPYYSTDERYRHEICPGLTGLAQVNGRNSLTWEKKFEYDVEYVNDCSFLLDVKIIIMTIKKVLVREGIGQGEQHPGSLHEIRKYALLKDEVEK